MNVRIGKVKTSKTESISYSKIIDFRLLLCGKRETSEIVEGYGNV